nr:MAG TPA: Protein of unknown function (DUF1246) [Caudoviricetes sp.]DAV10559.1 MAG TPA: Protein of unknown function (DUF1246) [Caudoviricetes sp.]DAX48266.1 MAG TPA: Protein of unknown function (DUF1246) [Caudoviricetes sp.]
MLSSNKEEGLRTLLFVSVSRDNLYMFINYF